MCDKIIINKFILLLGKIINILDNNKKIKNEILEDIKKNIIYNKTSIGYDFSLPTNYNYNKINNILQNKCLESIKIIKVTPYVGSQKIIDGGINLNKNIPNFISKNMNTYEYKNTILFDAINTILLKTKNINNEWSKTNHRVCEGITYWDWSNCLDYCKFEREKNKYYDKSKNIKYYGNKSRICLCGNVNKKFSYSFNYFLSCQSGSRCGFQNALGKLLSDVDGQIDMCDLDEIIIWGDKCIDGKYGTGGNWNPLLPCGVCYENIRKIVEHQYIPLKIYCYLPEQLQDKPVKKIIKIPFESLSLLKYYNNIMTKNELIKLIS